MDQVLQIGMREQSTMSTEKKLKRDQAYWKRNPKRRARYFSAHNGADESSWGLTREQFKHAGSADHFMRARQFAFGGTGVNRENFANALGFLTKNQKAQVAKGGFLSSVFHAGIPLSAVAGIALNAHNNGTAMDYVSDYAIPEVGMYAGWRVGKSVGFGIGSKMGLGTAGRFAMGIAGGVAAGVSGTLLGYGIGQAIGSLSKSNNAIKRSHHEIIHSDFTNKFIQSKSTLTHRQQALQQLSKSALNNRGALMGNEALVLKGLM